MRLEEARALVEKEFERFRRAHMREKFPLVYQFRETKQMLRKLRKVGEALKEKYGDEFISVNVVGSRAGGYCRPESDVDLILFFKPGSVAFRERYVPKDSDARWVNLDKAVAERTGRSYAPNASDLAKSIWPEIDGWPNAAIVPFGRAWKGMKPELLEILFTTVPVFGKKEFIHNRKLFLQELGQDKVYYRSLVGAYAGGLLGWLGSSPPHKEIASKFIDKVLGNCALSSSNKKKLEKHFAQKVCDLEREKLENFGMLPFGQELERQERYLSKLHGKEAYLKSRKHARFVRLYERKKLFDAAKSWLLRLGRRSPSTKKITGST